MGEIIERDAIITRSLKSEMTIEGDKLKGYAVVYGVKSVGPVSLTPGGQRLYEVIDKGTFDETLSSNRNVSFNALHADLATYGDLSTSTLKLKPDDKGIAFELDLPQYGQTLRSKIEKGEIKGMSFGMRDPEYYVKNGVRHITKGKLKHISAVYAPAYTQTSVSVVGNKNKNKLKIQEMMMKTLNT